MAKLRMVLVVAMVLAMAGVATADTLTLQQGADYAPGKTYDGCKDVYFSQSPGTEAGHSQSGASTSFNMFYAGEDYIVLMAFDLAPLASAGATGVTSATLRLYNDRSNASYAASAQQVGLDWDEGTRTGGSTQPYIDGATHRGRYAPTAVDKTASLTWVADGASYVLSNASDSTPALVDLPPDPRAPIDANRQHVRRGRLADDGGRLRGYENYHGLGDAYGSKAALDAATVAGWAYYYDDANDLLYARQSDGKAPLYINFFDMDNYWDYNKRVVLAGWSGVSDLVQNDWCSIDVTEMVQRWAGLDGYAQEDNFGLQLNTTGVGRGLLVLSSEYTADTSLRPMLVIEYVPAVPEPAGLALFGLAMLGLRRRRS